ncbi:hypothetical protein QBC46DRAFT_409014 [Diplogelasinospora grovesii]|uniref:Uncharacterized protein n=1 Tax=Diplogelasinospora grovesii TaxID=303347 RepID=A0AAN6N5L0_9PEZI|nr:hypothetical protein QBC46DRAFT_409014 [Diplogelasinospora grovesii]
MKLSAFITLTTALSAYAAPVVPQVESVGAVIAAREPQNNRPPPPPGGNNPPPQPGGNNPPPPRAGGNGGRPPQAREAEAEDAVVEVREPGNNPPPPPPGGNNPSPPPPPPSPHARQVDGTDAVVEAREPQNNRPPPPPPPPPHHPRQVEAMDAVVEAREPQNNRPPPPPPPPPHHPRQVEAADAEIEAREPQNNRRPPPPPPPPHHPRQVEATDAEIEAREPQNNRPPPPPPGDEKFAKSAKFSVNIARLTHVIQETITNTPRTSSCDSTHDQFLVEYSTFAELGVKTATSLTEIARRSVISFSTSRSWTKRVWQSASETTLASGHEQTLGPAFYGEDVHSVMSLLPELGPHEPIQRTPGSNPTLFSDSGYGTSERGERVNSNIGSMDKWSRPSRYTFEAAEDENFDIHRSHV